MDQDEHSSYHCASETGGWWYNSCFKANPTGLSSATKKNGYNYVVYHDGGERGIGADSWAEAEYLLVPNWDCMFAQQVLAMFNTLLSSPSKLMN